MDDYNDYNQNEIRIVSGLNVLAGLWLIISPFVLNYTSSANQWQQVIFGILVAMFALTRLAATRLTWPSWLNVIIGAWLIIAPWTFSNSTQAAKWNEVLTGIVVAVLALASVAGTLSSTSTQTR